MAFQVAAVVHSMAVVLLLPDAETTIVVAMPLHRRLMDYPPFMNADFDIHYVERWLEEPAAKA